MNKETRTQTRKHQSPGEEIMEGCKAREQRRVKEMVSRGNEKCTKYGLTPEIMDRKLSKYWALKHQTEGPGHAMLDHVLSVTNDLQRDVDLKGRQLHLVQEQRARVEKDAKHFRLEHLNYKLSCEMDKAEISELKERLKKVENWKRDRKEMEKRLEEIKKEYEAVERTCSKVEEESKSMRRIVNNVSDKLLNPRHGKNKSRLVKENNPTETEDSKDTGYSKVPNPPEQTTCIGRRPYTGRSRGSQMVKLPSITENNKVVMPDLNHQATPEQDDVPSLRGSSLNNVTDARPRPRVSRMNRFRMKLKHLM